MSRFVVLAVMAAWAMAGTGALLAGTNVWTSLGPASGPVTAIAIDPQNSGTVYAATGVGLLQSGDSGVLRRMNRPYDRDFYLDRCRQAYKRIPDLAITSDIMVGFPGEDRAAFENTLDMVRQVGYARAHLFRYSPRAA